MLEPIEIAREATAIARKNFGVDRVVRAIVEPALDSVGDAAWRITIVIKPEAVAAVGGEAVFNNFTQIGDRLRESGDESFPLVRYATEQELHERADSES
jgi:hypothetical protein